MLLRSGAVKVRLRHSSRARRLRLVLIPGVGPELVVPARTGARAIDSALKTLSPWLEKALARQLPDALGLARINDLGEQNHLQCSPFSDEARKPRSAPIAGDNAETRFG